MPPGTQEALDARSAPRVPALQLVPRPLPRNAGDSGSTQDRSLPSRPKTGSISALVMRKDEGWARPIEAGVVAHMTASFTYAASPQAALQAVSRSEFDAIVVELEPASAGGGQLFRELRQRCDAPIIVMTDDVEQAEHAVNTAGGADDYVLKPCSPRDLLARVRVAILRDRDFRQANPGGIQVGPLLIQESMRRASVADRPVLLTSAEFDLLSALAKRPGRALSRERLLRLVRGRDEKAVDRLIDVQVSRLRRKLAVHSETATMIRTVRCVGYMLVDPS